MLMLMDSFFCVPPLRSRPSVLSLARSLAVIYRSPLRSCARLFRTLPLVVRASAWRARVRASVRALQPLDATRECVRE